MLLTKAQRIAAQLDVLNDQVAGLIDAMGNEAYRLVNSPSEEQAVMDALGTTAAKAVARCSVLHTAALLLKAVEQGKVVEVGVIIASLSKIIGNLYVIPSFPPPDYERFQVQPDGTVTYVPPEPNEA